MTQANTKIATNAELSTGVASAFAEGTQVEARA